MVLSPIVKYTDEYSGEEPHPYYSHVTWDNINEMLGSGLIEIQNHSYDLHKSNSSRLGAKKKAGESEGHYKKVICENIIKARDRISKMTNGYNTEAFVYPFGAFSDSSDSILKDLGFKSTLICGNKINTITRDPECLYGLCRYIRPGKMSSEKYFKNINLQ